MNTFNLKIISSDRLFYEGPCEKLTLPATDGEKGVLPHHENMVIAIEIGVLRLKLPDKNDWVDIAVGPGFAEIINNRVTILVATAEEPSEIDARRAKEAEERAQEQLRQKQSIQEYYMTQASLARAMNRLKVSRDGKRWNI